MKRICSRPDSCFRRCAMLRLHEQDRFGCCFARRWSKIIIVVSDIRECVIVHALKWWDEGMRAGLTSCDWSSRRMHVVQRLLLLRCFVGSGGSYVMISYFTLWLLRDSTIDSLSCVTNPESPSLSIDHHSAPSIGTARSHPHHGIYKFFKQYFDKGKAARRWYCEVQATIYRL